MALSIAHVSFSSSGGAGTVATRLAEVQRELGHDATVYSALSGSLRDEPFALPAHTLAAVADDRVVRAPSFHAPISLYRDRLARPLEQQLAGVDVIHLHWINGFLPHQQIRALAAGRPVVWTLHDMNPFTGSCHYSLGCDKFTGGCAGCPATRSAFDQKVQISLQSKSASVREIESLTLVSPSSWLAGEATRSTVFRGQPITVIPNPLPPSLPMPLDNTEARARLGIGADTTVFFLSAAHSDDPVKNLSMAISAFTATFDADDDVMLWVAGRGSIDSTHPRIRHRGYLDGEAMHEVLSASDFLIVPSLAENQPLAIAEAQAFGVSVLCRDATGLPEHLDIDNNGALFSDASELSALLRTKASSRPRPTARRQLVGKARKKFDPSTVAKRYIDLVN